ncbi:MAG: DUF1015 family protein [candidate division Zixibacteria bacterium]|nr:DUF1015 family protein [candidate division Zixibacteria bacterium]
MTVVRPFRGLRPKPEYAKEVAAPPYDVLSAKEAREMCANNPNSFLRVNKAELEFDDNVDTYSEQVYQRAKDNLHRLIDDGIMFEESEPSLYLYRLTMDNKSQTGLIALASVDEYDKGLIKKHEHTRPEKVNDRANHIAYLNAQVGPVFTTYKHDHNPEIKTVFEGITSNPPEIDFTADDGVRHELWVVNDEREKDSIIGAFAKIPHIYVADGHHRSQSASEVRRRFQEANPKHTGEEIYNFFLNVVFPDDELNILPYNRVVKDMNGLTLEQLLTKASENFEITPKDGEVEPDQPHRFGLYCEGDWFLLKAKEGSFDPDDPTGSIDAAILGNNFIDPILGITNPKTDKRIDFVGGIRGTKELVKLVDSGEYKIAFSLHATSIDQLLKVADAGEVMPPKSTWFEPKLRSGMVVNLLND